MSNFIANEQDVEAVLRYLRLHFPDHATPEKAIKLITALNEKKLDIDKLSDDEIIAILVG